MSVRSTIIVPLAPEPKAIVADRPGSRRHADAGEADSSALRLMDRYDPDLTAARKRLADGASTGR